MSIAAINQLIALFQQSFEALEAPVGMPDAERLAMVVHQCMGATTRAYHATPHALGLCRDANAVETLAALFHDTVYYQLDGGIPDVLLPVLAGVVIFDREAITLATPPQATPAGTSVEHDPLDVAVQVFGYRYGQALQPFGGLNEFLSAVAAVRLLAPFVPRHTLIGIAACIEATIPFRPSDSGGPSALEALHARVHKLLCNAPLASPSDVAHSTAERMVHDALTLANRDVGGFAELDPAVFLSQTWLLIEESNKPLAAVGLYTIQDYRQALLRMDAFLAHLNPAIVFQHFRGFPNAAAQAALTEKAQANIAFSLRYLRAKLLAVAVLEAFASLSGGDAPISMFLGDFTDSTSMPHVKIPVQRPTTAPPVVDTELFRVLERGRARASANDLSASPSAAFLYKSLGETGLARYWEDAMRFFQQETTALAFLRTLPASTVLPLLDVCAHTAISRREALEQLRLRLLQLP